MIELDSNLNLDMNFKSFQCVCKEINDNPHDTQGCKDRPGSRQNPGPGQNRPICRDPGPGQNRENYRDSDRDSNI